MPSHKAPSVSSGATASTRAAVTRSGLRQILPPWLLFLGFTLLALVIEMEIFTYAAFGPEFGYFYQINARLTFWDLLHRYIEFGEGWYRPTAFYTPYFFVSKLVGWHHLVIWKLAMFATLMATCWALYMFTLLLFPRQHLGAFLACVYVAVHPAVYLPLFEISAFDFLYLFFVLVAAICFLLAWQEEGPRARRFNLAAVISYVLALTSKESSIVTPVCLTGIAAILLYAEGDLVPRLRRPRILRACRLLAPHFAVLILYVGLHVTQMPERPIDADYRTKVNVTKILDNTKAFPMWMIHLFRDSGPSESHVREQATLANDVFGWLVLTVALAQWSCDIRNGIHRSQGGLLAIWILIFMAVPVYAGAYLWHNNLSLCGYAVFAGVGLARFAGLFPRQELRHLYIIVLLAACLALGRRDVHNALYFGTHATPFRINSADVLVNPPVPRARIGASAFILIENPQDLHGWNFGTGNLFALAYDNPDVRQTEAPQIDHVPPERCVDWLGRKNAFFFRYDANYHWYDATGEFTRRALAQVGLYAEKLLAENRGKELAAALAPVAARFPYDATVQHYYARALGR